MSRLVPRVHFVLPWLAIATAVLGMLWEPLVRGEALAPYAALGPFEPWASETDLTPRNPLLLDQPLVTLPWLAFFAERLHAGEVPLWNPHSYLGQPIHAALTGGLMWPGHWPFLAWPDWRWTAWSAALELLAAGGFFHLLLRRFGLGAAAATAGGIGYALCGFQVVWLGHPHVHAALLLPLALVAVERCLDARAGRAGRFDAALVALCAFGLGVGGHAQTALHVTLWVGAWVLVRTWVGPRPRTGRVALLRLALGGAIGAALAAPQILPFVEYLRASRAHAVFASTDLVAAIAPWQAAIMLIDPHWFGDPVAGTYAGPVGSNLNYSELAGGFVGRVLGVFAVVGAVLVVRRRAGDGRFGLVLAGAVVGACFAWQVPPVYDVARELPILGSTKLMRFALLLAAALAALGALGLDRALRTVPRGRPRTAAGVLVVAVVGVELAVQGAGFNPSIEPDRVFAPLPTATFAAGVDGRVIGSEGTTFAPNANVPYGVSIVHGYDSLEVAEVTDVVTLLSSAELTYPFASTIPYFDRPLPLLRALGVTHAVTRGDLPDPFAPAFEGPGGLRTWADTAPQGRVWIARGIDVVPAASERLARLADPDFDPRVALVERAPAIEVARHDAPPGTARIVRDEPRHLVVAAELDAPGLLVVADAWFPGWSASVDGEPVAIERVDHALRGVWLAAGKHEVQMRYHPRSFAAGLWLAAAGLLALVVWLLVPVRSDGRAALAAARTADPTSSDEPIPDDPARA